MFIEQTMSWWQTSCQAQARGRCGPADPSDVSQDDVCRNDVCRDDVCRDDVC